MTGPRLRTRLALLHTGVTFACSVLLLAIVLLPLLDGGRTTRKPTSGEPAEPVTIGNLPEMLRYTAVALAVLAAVSVAFGWWIAGRAMRPLRVLTSAAHTMSAESLNSSLRVPAAYRELTELADTLDSLRHRLHEAFSTQRQFIANASHELRTPLTVQRTLLQLSLADPDATADTLRSACHDLLNLGKQQEQLIDALLTLATSYHPIESWTPFDLADLTRRTVLNRHPEAEHRGVRVHTTLAPAVVAGDPRLAASLVTNLIDNALRHNVPGGTVEVATTAAGRFTISNTGAQIPPAEVSRLFQPFQRIATDRTDQTDGHGLGLAIVAAVANAHHAPLTARPRPGGGLHITVDLPLAHVPR